jgi:serine/threonine protein phosphatase PrpC
MTQWGAASDVGTVREHNEDAHLAQAPVFVVADGMGGHAAGEVAARITVEQFAALAERDGLDANAVRGAVAAANSAILAWSGEHPETAGMGTTVTGACAGMGDGAPAWIVFNVGDSRVYRFADDALAQVTTDHSEVQELVAGGALRPDQARNYVRRNVVTRSLGSEPAPAPDVWVLPVVPGERFLVCSDGLTGEIDDDEIADLLRSERDPQQAADKLVAAAVGAGGHDNVTVIVADS